MLEQSDQPKAEVEAVTSQPVEGFMAYLDRIRKAIGAQTSDQPKRRKPLSVTFNKQN